MNPIEKLMQTLRGWFATDPEKLKVVTDTEAEIAAAAKQTAAGADNVDLQGLNPKIISLIQGQTEQIARLTTQVTEFSTRDKEREKAIQAAAAADQQKKIAADIEKAVADRKLAPKDDASKALWKSLLESNYEQAKSALDALPAVVAPENQQQTAQPGAAPGSTPAAAPDRATLVANARAAFSDNRLSSFAADAK